MKIETVFDKYKQEIINQVEEKTSLYWHKKSFIYNVYEKDIDDDFYDDIIDETADFISEIIEDISGIVFYPDNVAGFLKKKKIIKFVKK